MKKKKLFGIMGLILIIIPFISMNVEQVQSTVDIVEQDLVPQTIYTIFRNSHRYWDFGDIVLGTHTINIDFTSNIGVDSWFMTYDELLRWEASTPPYSKYHILYDKTARTLKDYSLPFNDHWVFVIDNTNLVTASVDLSISIHRTQVSITGTSFTYHDSDGDGYNDSLTLYFDVTLDRHVSMDFTYEIDFSYKGENQNDNIHETISDTTWINYERTISVSFNPDNEIPTKVNAKITVEININLETHSGDYDTGYATSTTLYYPKYGRQRILKTVMFIGIPVVFVTLIITTIIVIKRKRKVIQETETIESELEEQRFCPTCGDILEESGIFCANCGARLSE